MYTAVDYYRFHYSSPFPVSFSLVPQVLSQYEIIVHLFSNLKIPNISEYQIFMNILTAGTSE